MKQSIAHLKCILILMMVILFGVSCTDDIGGTGQTTQEAKINIHLQLPAAEVVETRATVTGTATENAVNQLYIFLFDGNASTSKVVKYFSYTSPTATDATKNVYNLSEVLPVNGTYTFLAVANVPITTTSITPGTTTRANVETLITNRTGYTHAAPLPMSGALTVDLSVATPVVNINLIRVVARVKISLASTVNNYFKPYQIKLGNARNAGVVLPSTFDNNPVTVPTLPSGSTSDSGALTALGTSSTTPWIQYIYENAHVGDYSAANNAWKGNPCLLIAGWYDATGTGTFPAETATSQLTYYRMDFINTSKAWLNVLRNHTYNFHITAVEGMGLDSWDRAKASKPINMVVSVINWNDGEAGDVIFDGQYYLSIRPKMDFQFFKDEDSETINVITDVPEGFQITKIVHDDGTAANWLSTDKITGNYYGINKNPTEIKISVTENNETTDRTGYIYIKAGRLEAMLTVDQSLVPKKHPIFSFTKYINVDGTGLDIPDTGGKVQAIANTNMDWKFCTDIEGVEDSMDEPASVTATNHILEVDIPANITWEPIIRKLWVLYKGVALQETLFTQAAGCIYVGRFGGKLVENEGGVWQFEKVLVVENPDEDETAGIKWSLTTTASGVTTDEVNGKSNTYALYKKSGTNFPAVSHCFKKNSNYSSINSVNNVNYNWFLPAQKQLMSIWVVNNSFSVPIPSTYAWSSTEYNSSKSWIVYFLTGYVIIQDKTSAFMVKCVREFDN